MPLQPELAARRLQLLQQSCAACPPAACILHTHLALCAVPGPAGDLRRRCTLKVTAPGRRGVSAERPCPGGMAGRPLEPLDERQGRTTAVASSPGAWPEWRQTKARICGSSCEVRSVKEVGLVQMFASV